MYRNVMAIKSIITKVMINPRHIPKHKQGLAIKTCKYNVPLKERLLSL